VRAIFFLIFGQTSFALYAIVKVYSPFLYNDWSFQNAIIDIQYVFSCKPYEKNLQAAENKHANENGRITHGEVIPIR
jgi:hypothetical protein